MTAESLIRNFCIIAHIDHGKSTLADRLLELTGTVELRAMRAQLLDSMELEREKGITIKLQPVTMLWPPKQKTPNLKSQISNPDLPGDPRQRRDKSQIPNPNYSHPTALQTHTLNLIDTPGHVDFSYEVSRSLAAVEGAILVVDAAQGIEAQTLANVYLAIEAGLEIIPVLNKIDLPAARPDQVAQEVGHLLGCAPEAVLRVSAKTGEGVRAVVDGLIERIPSPQGEAAAPLRCLIFDSIYDDYRGVILYVRVVDGTLTAHTTIRLLGSGKSSEAIEVGRFKPEPVAAAALSAGEIGYIVTGYKSVREARVGDTVTQQGERTAAPLLGYRAVKPFVFAGFFPSAGDQYHELKDSLEKLELNDAALQFSPESSRILGFGFRIGFLGLLHLEIIKERLEREFGLELIVTSPSTDYQVNLNNGETLMIRSAAELPNPAQIASLAEPWISGEVLVRTEYVGNVIGLINDIRGVQKNLSYPEPRTALIRFHAPLSNILTDFYDRLKSLSSGYGSFSYEPLGYERGDLVRLDILIGGELVDSLSQIVHRSEAQAKGRALVAKLKDAIPRQLYEVSLQAAIGGKVIAREDIKALGKNVTAKLYGGDVTRKNKLLDKQKRGKKRMKMMGKVEIPSEAFMVMLRKD